MYEKRWCKEKMFLIMWCPLSVTDCSPNSPHLNQPDSLLWKQTSSCTPRALLIWCTGALVCIFSLSSGWLLCQWVCTGGKEKKNNSFYRKKIFCLLSRVTAASDQRNRGCFKLFIINFVNNYLILVTNSWKHLMQLCSWHYPRRDTAFWGTAVFGGEGTSPAEHHQNVQRHWDIHISMDNC